MTVRFTNINATTAAFPLAPGEYMVNYDAANWGGSGTAVLQRQLGNGAWEPALDPFTKNGTSTKLNLAGKYRIALTGVSGFSIGLVNTLRY